MLTSLVGVVILLGGLIFFHEFGHYAVAKLFGVKVEVFSLGFGKKLFRRQIGETEYTLSLFPLGGYVKLMGDDPYKGVPAGEADRAFSTQKLYKRFLIVAAGPLANLLLAYVLFCIVFWFGQPMIGTRIGSVVFKSSSWEAGMRPKDRVLAVGTRPVRSWTEIQENLHGLAGQTAEILVERGNTELKMRVPIEKVKEKNSYGEDEEVGGLKGVSAFPAASVIGVPNPKSLAFEGGLRTGDFVTKVGTRTVFTMTDVNDAFDELEKEASSVVVSFKRTSTDGKEAEQTITLALPKGGFKGIEGLGIVPVELFVKQVTSGSPAEKGGLKAGDRVAKIGEEPLYSFERVVELVQEAGNRNELVNLTIERDGQLQTLKIKPVQNSYEDPLTKATSMRFMIGFAPTLVSYEAELTTFKIHDPIELVPHAVRETNGMAKKMVISLWKLAFGQISVKNLGGPVMIASVAGQSLKSGIIPFLQVMALISINLFLLNLFPVPILDGGHLLFFSIEALKGRPVSIRTMEIANQIGMALILCLVAVTLFNDISRIIQH